jgi:hypothetical protein
MHRPLAFGPDVTEPSLDQLYAATPALQTS